MAPKTAPDLTALAAQITAQVMASLQAQTNTTEAKVASHILAAQATAEDGETVNPAAAQVAALQKTQGVTITKTAPTPTGGVIRGSDGGPAVPHAAFPVAVKFMWSDGSESKDYETVRFAEPSVSKKQDNGEGGKPRAIATGKVNSPFAPGMAFQVNCNFTRIYKPAKGK